MRLVLASASPRRAELLRAAGFPFVVEPAEVDESPQPGEAAASLVVRLASAKATSLAGRAGDVILAADTVVVVDDEILGKPRDESEAAAMLERLAGRGHDVLTGIAIRHDGRLVTAVEATRVYLSPLSSEEIAWYVGSGEPQDKAGAYGIQGLASRFIDRIEGSYSNVVGLPVATVRRVLKAMSLSPLLL